VTGITAAAVRGHRFTLWDFREHQALDFYRAERKYNYYNLDSGIEEELSGCTDSNATLL
jgi:hypothetical protein